nr:class II glutamine amidotransferase [Bacteroidota bacterium]
MCGIVGYIGSKEAYPIIIKGLKRLEYRGYDSAGVALLEDAKINLYKKQGKVSKLVEFAENKNKNGHLGIGHTRWATHGEPNDVNSHPHLSNSGNLVMIHNGIIENYAAIKAELEKRGYVFHSETDTEVLLNLIEDIHVNEKVSLGAALRKALNHV